MEAQCKFSGGNHSKIRYQCYVQQTACWFGVPSGLRRTRLWDSVYSVYRYPNQAAQLFQRRHHRELAPRASTRRDQTTAAPHRPTPWPQANCTPENMDASKHGSTARNWTSSWPATSMVATQQLFSNLEHRCTRRSQRLKHQLEGQQRTPTLEKHGFDARMEHQL